MTLNNRIAEYTLEQNPPSCFIHTLNMINYGCLGIPIGTIIAIFVLQVTPILPFKVSS